MPQPIDPYVQRINELLQDNPHAGAYGYPRQPEPFGPEPDFSHLGVSLEQQAPEAPETLETDYDPDARVEGEPDFAHLGQPVGPVRRPPVAGQPIAANEAAMGGFGPGINTAANALIRQPAAAIGQGLQQMARDPLGTLQAGDAWHPSNLIQSGLQKLGLFDQTGPEIQAEAARERGPSWSPEQPIGPIKSAGEALTGFSQRPGLQAAPGWEGGLTDTVAGAFGTTALFLGTSVLGRGALPVGSLMGSYMSAGEAYDEAIRQGATPEQIKKATRIAGVGGATEPLPIEVILNRIPMPLVGKAVGIMGRLLAKAAAEGGQEVLQQGIQNFSENYAYNPEQDLTEGMATAFGLGSLVGGTFAGAVELGGGEAAPATAPGVTPPGPGVTTSAGTPPVPPGTAPPGVTTPAPGVTTLDEDDLAPLPAGLDEEVVIGEPLEKEAPVTAAVAPASPAAPVQGTLPLAAPGAAPAAAAPAVPVAPTVPAPVQEELNFNQPLPPDQAELPLESAPPATLQEMILRAQGRRPGAPERFTPPPPPASPWTAPPTTAPLTQPTLTPAAAAAPRPPAAGAEVPELDLAPFGQPIGTRRHPAAPEFAGTRVNQGASDAQRAVRNAEVGHYRWQPGVHVSIEVPVGAERHAIEPGRAPEQEPAWRAPLPQGVAYGRIRGTRDRTGRNIKTFVGPSPEAGEVYVIDQVNPDTGAYDQPKVMLDFASLEDARNAYVTSYSDGRGAERLGSISAMPIAEFKTWMKTKRTQRPFDRKATAASRRLRQAATAAAKQTAAAQAEQAAITQATEGLTDAEKATLEAEAPGIRGEPRGEPGPEYAEPDQAIADQERVPGEELPGRGAQLGEPGEARQPVPEAGAVAGQEEVRPTGQPGGEAAAPVEGEPDLSPFGVTEEEYNAKAVRSDQGQAEQEDVLRPGAGARGEDLQRQAPEQPSDRAPQRKERKEQPQQEALAKRWDKLPLEEKEELLKRTRVSRSPITRWKDLGEANQQKLQAAETTTIAATAREEPPRVTQQQQREVLAIVDKIAGDVRTEFKEVLGPQTEGAAHYGLSEITPAATTTTEWSRRDGRRLKTLLEFALKGEGWHVIEHAHHEAWHAIERAIGPPNARIMKASLPRLRQALGGISNVDQLSDQEVLAHGFGLWGADRYKDIHVGLRKYYRAVREFLRRLAVQLRLVNKTFEDIFREAERGGFRGQPQFKHQIFTPEGALADMPEAGAGTTTTSATIVKGRISTRLPTSKKAAPDTHEATIGAQDVLESQNAGLVGRYLGMGNFRDAPLIEMGEAYIQWQVDNLLFLYHAIPAKTRAQSKRWYAGANMLSKAWAGIYKLPSSSVSGVMAVLSPQKDWFQNASLAQRIIDINTRFANKPWTPAMTKKWNSIAALKRYSKVRRKIGSKSLSELTDKTERALWIRIYDETYLPRSYRAIHPSGKLGEFVQVEKGPKKRRVLVNARVTWGSLGEIGKADKAYHSGGNLETLSKLMGNAHKVRNFFNNINVPWDKIWKDVTIDTHAVAAAHLQPFSGKSPEVSHILGTGLALPDQFKLAQPLVSQDERYMRTYGKTPWKTIAAWKKQKQATKDSARPDPRYDRWHASWKRAQERQGGGYRGPKGSAVTGVKGTYGYGAEAYRRAAEQVGILPREMQSITWEAIRALFSAASKRNPKFVEQMRGYWRDVDAGKITAAEARTAILEAAGGAKKLSQEFRSTGLHDPRRASTYAEDIYRPELVREEAPDYRGPGRGAGAEAAAAGVESTTSAALSYPRRPPRTPDPAATWAMPEERRVLEEYLGEHGNLSLWNRRIANRVEAFARADPALQQTGVSDTLSLVEAEGRYSGSTSAAAEQLKHRYREPIFKALRAITGPTRTNDVSADFADYLYAMHSYYEANPYLRTINKTIGDPSGMSDTEALDIINNAHPEFRAIAQMVWAMNKESLRTMRANKTISKETFDELNKQQYWVPLRGWQEAEGDDFFSTGRGFDLRSPEFKTRMGRESKADNPLAYSLLAANTAIDRAGKNRVLRVLHRLIIERPNKDVWERNRAVKERYKYEDPKTGAISIKERWIPPQRVDMKRTVVVREDGVPYYLTLHDDSMLEAVRNLGAEELNAAFRMMGTGVRVLSKLYTTYSPTFALFRNPSRDLQTALILLGEENLPGLRWSVVKRLRQSQGGMWRYSRGHPKPTNKADDPALWYAHQYAEDGGRVGWMDMKTIQQQKREIEKAINGRDHFKVFKVVGQVTEDLNSSIENAVRLATYTELLERGYPRGKAAMVGKEVTTNFNRRGTWGPMINSMYMFFNARVQGAVRTGRAVINPRSNKVRATAIYFLPALGFLMSMLNRWAGGEDDDGLNRWDHAIPQHEKERNFMLVIDGVPVLKFPMTYGFNAFYVAGQQVEAAMAHTFGYGDGVPIPTAVWNTVKSILSATSPIDIAREGWAGVTPTLGVPFVEMWENMKFTGAPVYPTKYDAKDADADLYYPGIPPEYKAAAKWLQQVTKYSATKPALADWSPESLQHLADTYMGGAGKFWWGKVLSPIINNGMKALNGEKIEISRDPRDYPLAGDLLGSTENPFVRQNMYYEVWDKVDRLQRSIKDKELTSTEAREKYPLEAALTVEFNFAQKQLREQREQRKKIQNNKRLSSVELKRRLDAVDERMAKIRSGALKDYAEELKKQKQQTQQTLH